MFSSRHITRNCNAKRLTGVLRGAGAGHASLRDLYRCTHPVIDDLVARLQVTPGVLGARMIGGGWGGCVLALVEPGTRLEGSTHVLSDDALYRLE